MNLQIVANAGNLFLIDLTDARTTALGIDQLTLDTRNNANQAIALIDKAMGLVTSERTKYGAYQNALEHISNNVTNYKVNLTASESGIRNLDISKEIPNLTSDQVILQSAQAMLTQANQSAQSILQFLK